MCSAGYGWSCSCSLLAQLNCCLHADRMSCCHALPTHDREVIHRVPVTSNSGNSCMKSACRLPELVHDNKSQATDQT